MIEFDHVTKSFGPATVIRDLTLRLGDNAITVLIGPSGCGKSTTLRMINRLVVPEGGTVRVSGQDVSGVDPQVLRRGIGYAIQAGGLFPHWSVADNVATVPRLLGWPEARIRDRVAELLTLLGLPPSEYAQRRPGSLSGGQQQRVGIARAMAADPPLLLMDEPFSALDPVTRAGLQRELRRIHQMTGKTIVFVTHDMDEALSLADSIVILRGGELAQHGTPREIVEKPANAFVRDFVLGDNAGLRRLAVYLVRDIVRSGMSGDGHPSVGADATLRDALGVMSEARTDRLAVVDAHGAVIGHVLLADMFT